MKKISFEEIFKEAVEAEPLASVVSKSRSRVAALKEVKMFYKPNSARVTISVALAEDIGLYDGKSVVIQALPNAHCLLVSAQNSNRAAMTFTVSKSQINANKKGHDTITVQNKTHIEAIIDALCLPFSEDQTCITFTEMEIEEQGGIKYALVYVPDEFIPGDESESA